MSWKNDWKTCKKILCIRPDNLGDVIMMTPVFRALKESLGVEVSLLTSSVGEKVTPFIKDIDETIVYDAPWIENKLLNPTHNITRLIKKIKNEHFDGAILLTNFSQNPLPLALIAYLSGIPKILGYCRELPQELINYWVPDNEPYTFPKHGVLRQLTLLKTIGVSPKDDYLKLSIPLIAYISVLRKLQEKEVDITKPFIVLHPGISLRRRQYPPQLFVNAAKVLIQSYGFQILLTGTGDESVLCETMQQKIGKGSHSLANELSLEEFMAVINLAALVISNNTATVHIASAMQTDVVVLYARSNPEHTPWRVRNRVLYFDIPKELRTKNITLLATIPEHSHIMPQPEHIITAVLELQKHSDGTDLPEEITTWNTRVVKQDIIPEESGKHCAL